MVQYIKSPTCWILFWGCMLVTFFIIPIVSWMAKKAGIVDWGGHRKINKNVVPLMGGLSIAAPFIGICILGVITPTDIFRTISGKTTEFTILALGSLMIIGLGVLDDAFDLRARTKLVFQVAIALFVFFTGHGITKVELPVFGLFELGEILGALVTVLWIVGLINAFNMIDGIDGLAAGIASISLVGLAIIAAFNAHTFVVVLSLSLIGSLFAFLVFNFHPAKIFLGDTGSMFLGYVLAMISLMGSLKGTGAVLFLVPLFLLGIPIFETLTSIIRRYLHGRSILSGDAGHFHHRILNKGFSQRQTVMIIYGCSVLFTVSAVMTWILHTRLDMLWIPTALFAATLFGLVGLMGYVRPKHMMSLINNRKHNMMLSAFAHYAALKLSRLLNISFVNPKDVENILCKELNLSFIEAQKDDGQLLFSSISTEDEIEKDSIIASDIGKLMVRTANKKRLIIQYKYATKINETDQYNVESCLVNIFQRTTVPENVNKDYFNPALKSGGDVDSQLDELRLADKSREFVEDQPEVENIIAREDILRSGMDNLSLNRDSGNLDDDDFEKETLYGHWEKIDQGIC